ncbi:hypothetical protein V8E55_008129 [Tylopilus felleus]
MTRLLNHEDVWKTEKQDKSPFSPSNSPYHNGHAQTPSLFGADHDIGSNHDVDTQFLGPGNSLFRNYHLLLTGPLEFELANFLYSRNQMPAQQINTLLDIWSESLLKAGVEPLFRNHKELYKIIGQVQLGNIRWNCFSLKYTHNGNEEIQAPWKDDIYDIWFRCPCQTVHKMLSNPKHATKMDVQTYREYDMQTGQRRFQDFMSGDWAWDQADNIAEDPNCQGASFVPIILGSDKTTVSVATGQHDYYLVYLSVGNIRNTARPYMTMWDLIHFGDQHYRQVVYGLGPYIADYEEQVLLTCLAFRWDLDEEVLFQTCEHTDLLINELDLVQLWDKFGIPFTNNFPRADICCFLSPNIIHQLIKGTFKDHLVDWVKKFLVKMHNQTQPDIILNDIDRQIAAVALFAGLCQFLQGCHFKQWMGDDSKALMKVYIAAIEGYVPCDIVRTFRAFLEFCYLVHKDTSRVINTFSLPQQHSLTHYNHLIWQYGAPNGLCSLIMESKHVQAVKKPYWRTNHYQALRQIFVINQCLDKHNAARIDFQKQGMLGCHAGAFGTQSSEILHVIGKHCALDEQQHAEEAASRPDDLEDSEDVDGPRIDAYVLLTQTPHKLLIHITANTVQLLAMELAISHLPHLM